MRIFTGVFKWRIGLLLQVFLCALTVSASESLWWGGDAKKMVPAGAKVILELDRPEFFLGENVLVHFTLTNTSDQPFEANFGGDYRGATRSLRFVVTAAGEAGHMAEDPDPSGWCLGGFVQDRKLNPGEKFTRSLPLMCYCRILQPGRYTIQVKHDFGWKEGEHKRPVGEITVTFRMPTPAEAETVVTTLEKRASTNNAFGKYSSHDADFTTLCQSVYLNPLLSRAEHGSQNALAAIGNIETQEATAALIRLATNADAKLALTAAQVLTLRLPDPALEDTNGFSGFPPFTKEVRRRLVSRSWSTNFATDVRVLATNYLAKSGTNEISTGAFMVQAVGTLAEVPATFEAMERTLNSMVDPRNDPKDNILDQPEPLRELINAMNVLHGKGFTLQEGALCGEAQILMYFIWLAGQPSPRSDHWQEMVNAFGPNTRFPTQIAILNSIPVPLPDKCIEYVKNSLSDHDFGVCRAACTLAGKSGNKIFLKPLLEIIATEQHEWLLREASCAADKLGGGFNLFDAWVDRLAEEHLCDLALDNLQTIIEGLPGSSSGRTDLTRGERIELRNQWRNFLDKHADEIRSGKKFKLGDPALTPALFGRARTWQLPNGEFWPSP
jgi:hypothetical protein